MRPTRDAGSYSGQNIMPDFTRVQFAALGKIDIIVAVPSFRDAATVADVAAAAGTALAHDFAGLRGLVLNPDGDPRDSTSFVFNSTRLPEGVLHLTTSYNGLPGRGNALRLIAEAAAICGATVCVVLDPALQTPDPAWVHLLAAPVLDGSTDLVTPVYAYRAFADLPARLLAQPLAARLVTGDWAAPAATDLAFSAQLAATIAGELSDQLAVRGAGADLWLSYHTLLTGGRIAQVGTLARDRVARDPAVALGPDFAELAAAAFDPVLGNATANPRPAPPLLHRAAVPSAVMEPVEVTLPALAARFKRGAVTSRALWGQVLAPANLAAVLTIAAADYKGAAISNFSFPTELWVAVVGDWLRAYAAGTVSQAALLDGLGPLFNGFAAAFVAAARANPAAETALLQALGDLFRGLVI